ncbi:acyl-CoA reductase [Candidatus Lokiarchaeum ossiferum]|uniref:acyl-CoA reductase n=1 Tax=Candidatus Lokiarchaeum ossiferum TaxID=2951803 RepID=UPI00352F9014
MINIALFGGEIFYPQYKSVESLRPLLSQIQEGARILKSIPKVAILDIFHEYSKNLIKSPKVNQVEGVAFLSSWLKRNNFSQIVNKNFQTMDYLDHFIGEKKRLKAQPRGLACHWIAGNVPTLGLFSLFQSIFVGNANLLRIPPKSHSTMIALLDVFNNTQSESGWSGHDLLKSVGILYYDRVNHKANLEFSDIADIRIVWGGGSAVKAITGLPKNAHCEDIIFGPKYSFAVFDKDMLASDQLKRQLRFLVSDIFLFDQAACTSPHVVFFERGILPFEELVSQLQDAFKRAARQFPKIDADPYISSKIINIRAQYALDLQKKVICPIENDWTILINSNIQLEDPVESRTIFLKEVDSVMEALPLITKKIQTIGCAISDKEKLVAFADEATFKGVSRCVNLGQMHLFDSPWDGMLFMSRLVNWTTLYYGK